MKLGFEQRGRRSEGILRNTNRLDDLKGLWLFDSFNEGWGHYELRVVIRLMEMNSHSSGRYRPTRSRSDTQQVFFDLNVYLGFL